MRRRGASRDGDHSDAAARDEEDSRASRWVDRGHGRLTAVPGRSTDDAAATIGLGQVEHLVEDTARFERSGLLEILSLEPDLESGFLAQ